MRIILASTKILRILENSHTKILQRHELNNLLGRANIKNMSGSIQMSGFTYCKKT